MAITNVRQQVTQDFRDKISLEPELGKRLRVIDREIMGQFRRDMLRGQILRADDFQPDLEEILKEHYAIVIDKFEGRIAGQIPADVGLSTEELAILAAALLAFTGTRAVEQSGFILATTQADMQTAAQIANAETPDPIERSVVASALLSRRLQVREPAIAALETQAMAEAVKGAEFDMLVGRPPFSPQSPPVRLNKEWVTVGDARVRIAHANADAQVRPVDQPFIVNGQRLRWPGDTALGASAGNVMRCRCSAVYDTGAIAAIRREIGGTPTFTNVPTPALLTSLG